MPSIFSVHFSSFFVVAAALVANQKRAVRFEHSVDYPETLQKVRPEVNCLKCGDQIKPVRREDEVRDVPLQNDAAAIQNGVLVDLFFAFSTLTGE